MVNTAVSESRRALNGEEHEDEDTDPNLAIIQVVRSQTTYLEELGQVFGPRFERPHASDPLSNTVYG